MKIPKVKRTQTLAGNFEDAGNSAPASSENNYHNPRDEMQSLLEELNLDSFGGNPTPGGGAVGADSNSPEADSNAADNYTGGCNGPGCGPAF